MPNFICLMFLPQSATAVGDISFEAQTNKDVLNEVTDNVIALKAKREAEKIQGLFDKVVDNVV